MIVIVMNIIGIVIMAHDWHILYIYYIYEIFMIVIVIMRQLAMGFKLNEKLEVLFK